MEFRAVEKTKDGIKLEVAGETHTLLNLIRENAFKNGAAQASYIIEHPYMSQPMLIIKSGQPKKVMKDSADQIVYDVSKFKKAFEAELK
jgi:DNA-directed RNA polymerase subunit L